MNYTEELRKIISHIVENSPGLSYIKPEEVLILGKFDRGGPSGAVAVCNCIKLKGGAGKLKIKYNKNKIKYFIEFSFPRFLNLPESEKLKTIIHELFHISPDFDGTLRKIRHGKDFDRKVMNIVEDYFVTFGYPSLLTHKFKKVQFFKWNKKPRYLKNKVSYDEKDIRLSTCDIQKFNDKFKFIYVCPFCKTRFYLPNKARGLTMYYCKKCVKKGEFSPSSALIFSGERE